MNNAIKHCIEQGGTPFYIFDEKGFIENYKRLNKALKDVYPDYQLSYSYKTNYTPYICNLVKSLGGYAEVVSDMEYSLAKKLGYDNSKIVYNGPSKGDAIYEHLDNGGILNIDSEDEAKRIINHCIKHPDKKYTCGLRINMDLGGFISRFGLSPDGKGLEDVVKMIDATPNLDVVGIHCHISRHRNLEAWAERARIMIAVADKYIKGAPRYISLGSGMFADMCDFLKKQFGENNVPTYEEYAEAAIRPFAERYRHTDRKPVLFTEPGTTVIARYISFISKVLSIKEIRGRQIANMDGDYHNLGEICTMKKLPVEVISQGNRQQSYSNLDIMGSTCLEQDLMYPGFEKPIAEGDILVFNNVGGYSIVSKPQFIKPQSAMYVEQSDGNILRIMRPETFDDVFSKFIF